jgi:hypothetical protein
LRGGRFRRAIDHSSRCQYPTGPRDARRRREASPERREGAKYQTSKFASALEKRQIATLDLETQIRKIKEAENAGDNKARYLAMRDAEEAARNEKQAEASRMLAHERLTAAAHKQNDQLIKAREAPGSVAQEVGNQMRRGEITPNEAPPQTDEVYRLARVV